MKWLQNDRSKYRVRKGYHVFCYNPFSSPEIYIIYYDIIHSGTDLKETYERYIKLLYEK